MQMASKIVTMPCEKFQIKTKICMPSIFWKICCYIFSFKVLERNAPKYINEVTLWSDILSDFYFTLNIFCVFWFFFWCACVSVVIRKEGSGEEGSGFNN